MVSLLNDVKFKKGGHSIMCPICGMGFEKFEELIAHLRELSCTDKNHEILLTAYFSMRAHIERAIDRLFGRFIKKLHEAYMQAKKLKRPSEAEVSKIITSIEDTLSKVPDPSDPIEKALYDSVITKIKSALGCRHKTKSELLRIISTINSLFTYGRKAYFSMLIKAALILCEKYFVNV